MKLLFRQVEYINIALNLVLKMLYISGR